MDSRVLNCTALGSKCWRWTVCAWNIRSLKGRANRASTSCRVQRSTAPVPAALPRGGWTIFNTLLTGLNLHLQILPLLPARLDDGPHAHGHDDQETQAPHRQPQRTLAADPILHHAAEIEHHHNRAYHGVEAVAGKPVVFPHPLIWMVGNRGIHKGRGRDPHHHEDWNGGGDNAADIERTR